MTVQVPLPPRSTFTSLLVAMAGCALAATMPAKAQWRPCVKSETPPPGTNVSDVVFVLDVSSSMAETTACEDESARAAMPNHALAVERLVSACEGVKAEGGATYLARFPAGEQALSTPVRWRCDLESLQATPAPRTPVYGMAEVFARDRAPHRYVVFSDFEQYPTALCEDDCQKGLAAAVRVRYRVRHSDKHVGERCGSAVLVSDDLDGTAEPAELAKAILARLREPMAEPTPLTTLDPPLSYTLDGTVAVGGPNGYVCSGVVVDRSHVLTARHCLPATQVAVATEVKSATIQRAVVSVHTPPDPAVDLALLVLQEPLDVTLHPVRNRTDFEPPRGRVWLAGFGAQDPTGRLGFGTRHVTFDLAEGWGCDPAFGGLLGCHPSHELVLDGSGDRDTCSGDSGGPVFEIIRRGDMCNLRLIAITSRAVMRSTVACGQGGIYSRVDVIWPWLSRFVTISKESANAEP
jgi:hypothetical protein